MMMIGARPLLCWRGTAGYLTDNCGRLWNYIQDVPFFAGPYAFIIHHLATIAYFIFHRTNYGRRIIAVGDNMRARIFPRQVKRPRIDLHSVVYLQSPVGS
jgi:ribose/xylose/arabinose/galactoside ABC-type transport system permease subunit